MSNEMVTLTLDQTVREALLRLREHLKQTDFTHFLYVVENEAEPFAARNDYFAGTNRG